MKRIADLVITKTDFGTISHWIKKDGEVRIVAKYTTYMLRRLSGTYTSHKEDFIDDVKEQLKAGWTIASASADFDLSLLSDDPK
ncbi:MAG: hypothetical protein WCI88_07050 [Chloroflexota bacterium]